MNKLSIIVPVFFNEENLRPLYKDISDKIIKVIDFEYEIIMVDDGSQDKSWETICELANENTNIKPIKLSRNFGSHAAILCGLSHATGDCAIVKAADLQEPTELILKMYQEWKDGNRVILAVREEREDKSFFSDLYYQIVRKFAIPSMPEKGFDVFLIDRKVIDVLTNLDEVNSALTCQILWSGFRTKEVFYIRTEREIGTSKWTFSKKIRLVMDTLFSFSTVPISVITGMGFCSSFGAICWAFFVFIGHLRGTITVEGFTTLFIFHLFSFGVIMLTLGILGNYIWRIFDASRNRPVYIVDEMKAQEQTIEK